MNSFQVNELYRKMGIGSEAERSALLAGLQLGQAAAEEQPLYFIQFSPTSEQVKADAKLAPNPE